MRMRNGDFVLQIRHSATTIQCVKRTVLGSTGRMNGTASCYPKTHMRLANGKFLLKVGPGRLIQYKNYLDEKERPICVIHDECLDNLIPADPDIDILPDSYGGTYART